MFRTSKRTTLKNGLSAKLNSIELQPITTVQKSSKKGLKEQKPSETTPNFRRRRRRLGYFGSAPNPIRGTWF